MLKFQAIGVYVIHNQNTILEEKTMNNREE